MHTSGAKTKKSGQMKTKMMLIYSAAIVAMALSVPSFAADDPKSDLEGIWDMDGFGRNGHPRNPVLTEAGQARLDSYTEADDPSLKCLMPGVPLGVYDPYPLEIIEQEHQVVFLHEHFHMVRRIYMDGREADEFQPHTLAGFSTGHWEGDTLVVETTHLIGELVRNTGMPFSGPDGGHMTEHYRREGDALIFDAIVHDEDNYKKPYVIQGRRKLNPEGVIFEYECYPEYGGMEQ
jgi:hypothetical protein